MIRVPVLLCFMRMLEFTGCQNGGHSTPDRLCLILRSTNLARRNYSSVKICTENHKQNMKTLLVIARQSERKDKFGTYTILVPYRSAQKHVVR